VRPEEKQLLRSSLGTLLSDADTAASVFYTHLFAQEPSLRALFTSSIREQGHKFTQMLAVTLASIDSLDNVVPLLWQMGKRHRGYGVTPTHYDAMAVALFAMLEQQLGKDFTPDVRAAWTALYSLMASTMKQAASEGSLSR
jgi:hemoglobin-like flavoprotein